VASVGPSVTSRAAAVTPPPCAVCVASEHHGTGSLVAAVLAARRARYSAGARCEQEWIGRHGAGACVLSCGRAGRARTCEDSCVVVDADRRRVAPGRLGTIAGCRVLAPAPERRCDRRDRQPSLHSTLRAPHPGRNATATPVPTGRFCVCSEGSEEIRAAEHPPGERKGARGRTGRSWRRPSRCMVGRPSAEVELGELADPFEGEVGLRVVGRGSTRRSSELGAVAHSRRRLAPSRKHASLRARARVVRGGR
jgi:hypothetical protein